MTAIGSLLDAVAPPRGYQFESGVWITHDLNVPAVTRLLLPALAGLGAAEGPILQSAPLALSRNALVVCAAADRIQTTGLLPDAVTVLPVAGRRQHAKAAVLRYTREKARKFGPTSITRTLVTSANLTHGGLATNRELVAVETLDSDAAGESILRPVLDAIRALRPDLAGKRRMVLTRRLKGLDEGASVRATRSPTISHSLAGVAAKPFPAHLGPKFADRLLLVGPAFAADSSDVAALLDKLIGPDTKIDLVTEGTATAEDLRLGRARVRVPSGLLSGLRSRTNNVVTVHATPTDDKTPGVSRRLHGKTVMTTHGSSSSQLIGSANITRTGLAGRNRELVLRVDIESPNPIEDEIRATGAIAIPDSCITHVHTGADLPEIVRASAAPLLATFEPDPGQRADTGLISGTITVLGVSPSATIRVNGALKRLRGGKARVQLDPYTGEVVLVTTAKQRSVLVSVAPTDPQSFWNAPVDIAARAADPMLALLLADVERAARQAVPGSGPSGGHSASGGQDGFRLPGNVRLNVLARHRRVLQRYDRDRQDEILDQLFGGDAAELAVAEMIAAASRADEAAVECAVLRALASAVREASGGDG